MTDPTNRYRIPAKRAAYEEAILLASKTDTLDTQAYLRILQSLAPYELSHENRLQVAAKAVRVERYRRRCRKAKEEP